MGMSDKKLLKFHLDDGTPFLVEVAATGGTSVGPELAGKKTDQLIEDAKQSFDQMLDVVGPVTKKLADRLRTGLTQEVNEVEVKFGLKLTGGADLVFATAGGEVNFEVTLKWKNG
jgi:Trypsin-co-occurring domain 1